jgi:hypothetical protein
MDADYEKRLEAAIDRLLKELPEMSAPHNLASRVLASIESRASVPWYRQSWQIWPVGLRVASFVILAGLFAAVCFASWKIVQAESFLAATQRVGGWFSSLSAIWNAINVLAGALVLAVKQLGTGFIIACVIAMAFGYAMCIGAGTVYFRLGFARR